MSDPKRGPHRIIVPGFGNQGAVVYRVTDKALRLETIVNWIPPKAP